MEPELFKEEIKGKNLTIKNVTNSLISLGKKKLLNFDNKPPKKMANSISTFSIIFGDNFPTMV